MSDQSLGVLPQVYIIQRWLEVPAVLKDQTKLQHLKAKARFPKKLVGEPHEN